MHLVVITKGVPDFREGKVSFDEDGHLERGKTPTVMNPNDKHALRGALQTKVRHGGEVSLMTMGPPGYADVLREGMADVYADHLYHLTDREMAAADTWATAITLSAGLDELETPPDLVFAGFKTADGETGHTGPQTCWAQDMPLITHVVALDVDEDREVVRAKRLVEGDIEEIETVEAPMPAFIVMDPDFEPSYPRASDRLRLKDLKAETAARAEDYEEHLTALSQVDLNLDPDYIGLDGSPTIVSSVDPIPKAPAERDAEVLTPEDPEGMEQVLDELQPYAGAD